MRLFAYAPPRIVERSRQQVHQSISQRSALGGQLPPSSGRIKLKGFRVKQEWKSEQIKNKSRQPVESPQRCDSRPVVALVDPFERLRRRE